MNAPEDVDFVGFAQRDTLRNLAKTMVGSWRRSYERAGTQGLWSGFPDGEEKIRAFRGRAATLRDVSLAIEAVLLTFIKYFAQTQV